MARKLVLTLIAAFAILALAMAMPQLAVAQDTGNPDGTRALVEAYNASGLALFKRLAEKPGNIVLSPLSIGTAMAMALSGARGETEREMAGVLDQHLDRAAMEAANGAVLTGLARYDQSAAVPRCPAGMRPSGSRCEAAPKPGGQCDFPARREGDLCVAEGSRPPSARLAIANALMLTRRGDLIAKDYVSLLANRYGAEVFQNAGVDDVNGWVKRKTEGRIEKIIDRLDSSSAAVILNAIYFKAKWEARFTKAATQPQTFNLSRQKTISVPTMTANSRYALVTRAGYRAIRLAYDVKELGMVVVLPDAVDGLATVTAALNDKEWASLLDALRAPAALTQVDLALPRFKTSFGANLAPLFGEAGMKRAFDLKQADFSGMTGKLPSQVPLALGTVEHRAFIDVMEDGTEAAAATAIGVAAAAYHEPPKAQPFHVDRPFVFAIVDDVSGAVLFEGRIVDPR